MEQIITRKFRLHWVDNQKTAQVHLRIFFNDYITKANELIQNIFSLKLTFDQKSPTAFRELFQNTGNTAYNDLYTTKLDLKHFGLLTQSGVQFKQRTMRMMTADVYYAIRNYLVRIHNLQIILTFLVKQSATSPSIWLTFIQKGQLSHVLQLELKKHLKKPTS